MRNSTQKQDNIISSTWYICMDTTYMEHMWCTYARPPWLFVRRRNQWMRDASLTNHFRQQCQSKTTEVLKSREKDIFLDITGTSIFLLLRAILSGTIKGSKNDGCVDSIVCMCDLIRSTNEQGTHAHTQANIYTLCSTSVAWFSFSPANKRSMHSTHNAVKHSQEKRSLCWLDLITNIKESYFYAYHLHYHTNNSLVAMQVRCCLTSREFIVKQVLRCASHMTPFLEPLILRTEYFIRLRQFIAVRICFMKMLYCFVINIILI